MDIQRFVTERIVKEIKMYFWQKFAYKGKPWNKNQRKRIKRDRKL
jgi:hypothetical protein